MILIGCHYGKCLWLYLARFHLQVDYPALLQLGPQILIEAWPNCLNYAEDLLFWWHFNLAYISSVSHISACTFA